MMKAVMMRTVMIDAAMTRRLGLLALLALAVCWGGLGRNARAEKEVEKGRYNVLFIICDDLNCDLKCYGHRAVRSPNIDRLAQRGVRFANAYCQYPLCGPSRASFLTGLYPDQTLIRRNAMYLRTRVPNVMTLPQMFRQNGYFAMRIGKLFHYGVPRNIGTGGHDDPDSWDYTINPRGRDKDDEPLIFSLRPGSFGGTLSWLAADGTDEEQTDGIGAAEAVKALRGFAKSRRPFFLAVGFYRPHTPYVAPKKYFGLYPTSGIEVPEVPEGYLKTLPRPARRTLLVKKNQVNLDPKLARQAIQAYHASITFVDRQVGKVLDALDETGLADNTIVLFTSDHGYHMGEHGWYQKQTLFENGTHVPLIISVPGSRNAGRTAATMAEMVDFYPTLAELCGLKPPAYLSGVSLVPALVDTKAVPRTAALTQLHNGYSLRTRRYRYTEWGENGSLGAELYDRESDPAELVNLASRPDRKDVIQRLSRQLRQRIKEAQSKPAGVRQTPTS